MICHPYTVRIITDSWERQNPKPKDTHMKGHKTSDAREWRKKLKKFQKAGAVSINEYGNTTRVFIEEGFKNAKCEEFPALLSEPCFLTLHQGAATAKKQIDGKLRQLDKAWKSYNG